MKTKITLLLVAISFSIHAQHIIEGSITDRSGEPLIGANVFIPSTYEGTTTDLDGQFNFNSTAEGTVKIIAQYLGYAPDSISATLPISTPIQFKLKESINSLAEVVVTGGALEASDTRKTAVLNSIDIVTTGATGDLVEALSVLPGSTPAGESGQLLVRGGAASETQAYINGLRVPKFYTSSVPDAANRSRFNPFDFKGITFATGGFSAQYGETLSAALILQSQNLPEQDRWSVGLMSIGGSIGHTNVWGKQAFSLSANYTNIGGYKLISKEAQNRFVKTPQNGGVQTGYWWETKSGGMLKVYGQASKNVYEGIHPEDSIFYGGTNLSLNNQNVYGQVVYQQPDGENGLWEFGAAVAMDQDRIGVNDFGRQLFQKNYQLRAKRSGQLGNIAKWTAGASFQDQFEEFSLSYEKSEFTPLQDLNRKTVAAFAEADWFLNKKWLIRTGLRYDHYLNSPAQVSPRFQISHIFSPNHQIALSGGRYVQRDIPEMAFSTSLDFAPAKADHLMLTYFKSWKGRLLRMEGYYKKYNHLVSTIDGINSPDGFGHAKGVDLFFRDRKSFKNTDIWVSMSLIDSKRKWRDTPELSKVPFSAEQVLSVVYKRFFPKPSFGINVTYRWHTGRPYNDPNLGGFYQKKTPHYHDLSANITYLTNIKNHFTVIFISMTNVANFDQVHTYRFEPTPNENGIYPRSEVRSLLPRFPFVGVFMNINERNDKIGVDDM